MKGLKVIYLTAAVTSFMSLSCYAAGPVLLGMGSTTYNQGSAPVQITPGLEVISVKNLYNATVTATSNLTGQPGKLIFGGQGQIYGRFDPESGVLTLTGTDTPANYQAALRSITYDGTDVPRGPVKVTYTVTDTDGKQSPLITSRVLVDVVDN